MSTWWHMYAGWTDLEGGSPAPGEGCWAAAIAGPSGLGPDDNDAEGSPIRDPFDFGMFGTGPLPYLASWDHEPTDDEKIAVTPPAAHDDDCECGADHEATGAGS